MIFPAYKKVWFTELVKIAFRAQKSPVVTCLHNLLATTSEDIGRRPTRPRRRSCYSGAKRAQE